MSEATSRIAERNEAIATGRPRRASQLSCSSRFTGREILTDESEGSGSRGVRLLLALLFEQPGADRVVLAVLRLDDARDAVARREDQVEKRRHQPDSAL